ncbi:hypothetical protein THAOC_29663, partial [Thalassiosira oceanica]
AGDGTHPARVEGARGAGPLVVGTVPYHVVRVVVGVAAVASLARRPPPVATVRSRIEAVVVAVVVGYAVTVVPPVGEVEETLGVVLPVGLVGDRPDQDAEERQLELQGQQKEQPRRVGAQYPNDRPRRPGSGPHDGLPRQGVEVARGTTDKAMRIETQLRRGESATTRVGKVRGPRMRAKKVRGSRQQSKQGKLSDFSNSLPGAGRAAEYVVGNARRRGTVRRDVAEGQNQSARPALPAPGKLLNARLRL